MSDNHIDYLEQLFQGVDILIERKLKDVSFDTTIICTVTDASDSKNGRYQVTDGTIRFEAYSDNDKYKVNDQVRVSIARGDYTDKKYIIGKYVSDNNTQPITYISPLDTIVNITGNLIPANKQNADIIANGTTKEKLIWNESLADGSYTDLQTNGIYSAITLKADFRTFLHNYNIKSGSYGLRLDLIVKPTKDSTTAILKTAYLDSSEMFGNPYAFSIATQQTKIFDIGTAGIITGVALSLYQNGDFIDVNGIPITSALIGNIIVENIEIGFGSNLVSIGDNTLQIYTESDPQYKYFGHEPYPYDAQLGYPNTINKATNEKTLGLLWYNKNDLNEYLGFSDGIYDPNYDEITYLSEANQDARLIAQLGRDGIPTDSDSLKLAADLEDAISLITSANKIITQDLITTLRAFKSQLQDIPSLIAYIDDLIALTQINDEVIPLSIIAANIQSNLTNLQSQYLGVLGHGVKTQNNSWLDNTEKNESWNNDWDTNYGYNIKTLFEATRAAIEELLTNIYNNVYGENAAYSGYAGIYDTYKIRLEKVLLSMEVYLQENNKYHFPIDVFNGINQTLLSSYKNTKTYWKSYVKKDLSQYDNRYCIYWFRYEKDYNNTEPYQFLSSGWRRLTDIPHNTGLPGSGEIIDTKLYNAKKLNAGEGLINVLMRFNEPEEKYKAVLFYNHAMYESNEIVFTNEDRIPEVANVETGDLLLIKHIDKSRDNYQCYNLTNYLMDSADASHLRQVRVSYDGLLHGDDILPGGGIYWYVPNTSTMLTVDIDELSARGFVNDSNVNPKPPYHKPGYICFYKQIQGEKDEDGKWNFNDGNGIDTRDFWYKIKPYYDASANINSIKCEFRAASDNDIVTGETFFSFGIMGSNGTKYTLSINPATNQVATLPTKDLILDVSLRDFNNEEIDLKVGANAIGETSEFNSNWLFKLSGNAPTPILNGTTVTGLTAFKGSCGIVQASTKFQLSAAGTTETTNGTTKYRTVTLETVRAIPAAAGDYYLSGPTSIVYNSFGTIDNRSMFDNPYKLFAMKTITLGSKTYNPNDQIDVNWDFNYYDSNGNKLSDEDKTFYENYMPVLNDAGGLTPAPMYLDNLNCYMVIEAYAATTNDLLWSQPIVITQNRFASSVLNDWDGSLTIDEKNGTILSSMIGAGRKTDHNTFEGVLMGNIAVGTSSDIGFEKNADIGYANHTGLGLYGFHDGAQSFGFNVDGTAFLGKAGRGRIIFNGNQGVIASSNWFLSGGKLRRDPPGDGETQIEVFGTDGMCIDLENGHIDAYNFKLTSKNIYLNSSPVTSGPMDYYFRIGNTGIEGEEAPTPGILTFDREGHLILQADRFTLNSNLGGTNLLLNTAPVQYLGDNNGTSSGTNPTTGESYTNPTTGWMWDFSPWTPTNIITITNDTNKVKMSIFNISTKTGISQVIEDIKVGKEYTASVYVYPKGNQVISMATKSGIVASTLHDEWEYLTLVFTAEENDTITFAADSNNFQIWHPKVEEGTVATTWGASPKDSAKAQERTNAMFSQDNMWSVLSQNGTLQGTWLVDNKLYINAEFITAGALASVNWKNSGGKIADDGTITNYGSAGMAISLKTGEIHSANFHLVAGTSGKLELNSDPGVNKPYLFVGNDNNYISFKRADESNNTSLAIASNIFTLTAGTGNNIITINSQAKTYPLSIADNFQVEWDGTLHASGAVISGDITATTINVTGTGSIGNWKVTAGGNLQSSNNTVILNGTDGSISGSDITGGSIEIKATDNSTNFKVDSSGKLTGKGGSLDLLEVTSSLTIPKQGNLIVTGKAVIGGSAVSDTYQVDISGTTYMSGALTIKAGYIYLTEDKKGGRLYVSGDCFYISDTTWFWANTSYIKLGKNEGITNIGIGCNPYTKDETSVRVGGSLFIDSNTEVTKDITYKGDIWCMNGGTPTKGYTGEAHIKSTFKSGTLQFVKGILVGSTGDVILGEGTSVDVDTGFLPSATALDVGKVLQVTGASTFDWALLYAPTSKGIDKYIWASNGSGETSTPGWRSISAILGSGSGGQVLKMVTPNTGGEPVMQWADDYDTWQVNAINQNGYVTAPTSSNKNKVWRTDSDGNPGWGTVSYASSAGSADYADSAGEAEDAGNATTVSLNNTAGTFVTSWSGKGGYGTHMRKTSLQVSSVATSSSRKYKHNIFDIDNSEILYKLRPVSFLYNSDMNLGNNKRYGFIAEEVMTIDENLVSIVKEKDEDNIALYYNSILTLAVAEIQKLRKELDELKSNLNI